MQRGLLPIRLPPLNKEATGNQFTNTRLNRFKPISQNTTAIKAPLSLNSSIIHESNPETPRAGVIPPKNSVRNASSNNKHRPSFSPQIPVKKSNETERPRSNSLLQSNGLFYRRRTPQTYFERIRFSGMWERYEEVWFGIHSQTVTPLLFDFPTSKAAKLQARPFEPKYIKQTQPERKNFVFSKLPFAVKTLRSDQFGRSCDKCNQKVRKGVNLGCKHFFCKPCLHDTLKIHLEQKVVPILCCVPNCHYELEKVEIMKMVSNTEEIQRFYELFMTKYVDKHPNLVVRCFTNACGYVVNLQRLKNKNVFHCSRCQRTYCIKCHEIMHFGRECRDTGK